MVAALVESAKHHAESEKRKFEEIQQVMGFLEMQMCKLVNVIGDGNCLYSSLSTLGRVTHSAPFSRAFCGELSHVLPSVDVTWYYSLLPYRLIKFGPKPRPVHQDVRKKLCLTFSDKECSNPDVIVTASQNNMSTETRCQYIFSNLLKTLDAGNAPSVKSSHFVRELLVETPRCDKQAPLISDVRKAYEAKLKTFDRSPDHDGGIVSRLVAGPGRISVDEEAASIVVFHYNEWTYDRLLSSFSWPNWFGYQVSQKWERTTAFFTLGALGYGGYRVLKKGVPRMMQNSADWVSKRGSQNSKPSSTSTNPLANTLPTNPSPNQPAATPPTSSVVNPKTPPSNP